MPDTTGFVSVTDALVEEARALVAAVVVDDVGDLPADEDLRDSGLDSIRLMSLLNDLRASGVVVELETVATDPTLQGLAGAIAAARADA